MCQQTESAWPPARGPTPNFEHSKGPDFLSGYGILLDDCMSALVDHAYLVAGSIGMPQEDPMLLSAEGTLLVGLALGIRQIGSCREPRPALQALSCATTTRTSVVDSCVIGHVKPKQCTKPPSCMHMLIILF